jgi:subtilisin family serine protease
MVDAVVLLKAQADVSTAGTKGRRARIEAVVTALQSRASTSQRGLRSLLRQRRSEGEVAKFVPLWIVNGIEVVATQAVIDELERQPEVAEVRANEVIQAPEAVQAALAPEPNVALVNAAALWNLGFRGHGVVVASMDTGVDVTHPDLAGRWRGGSNSWFDPNDQHPTTPVDVNGHGTSTMGVMVGGDAGGSSIGIAPDAKWIAVKIFNDQGSATATGIHLGFQWLLDPDGDPATPDAPNVVNNSWTLTSTGCNVEFQPDLQNLRAAGILSVFAAGNGGPGAGTSMSPANNSGALAVGSTNNSDTIASSSSRGPSACGQPVYPQVVAPGVSIRSSDLFGLYARMSGTSLAAPHVSGALALLLSAFPGLLPDRQEAALEGGAVDLGALGADDTFGFGRLDALAAYQWLQGSPSPPDFTVAATPDSVTTPAGGTALFDVSVGAVNGFSGDVSLSLGGLTGSQATWSFSPAVVAGGSGGSQLTIATDPGLAPGLYPLDIAATDGAITHHAAATLVVPAPPDFTVMATPGSVTTAAGGTATFDISVGAVNGFADDVSLSLDGLSGSQATWSFSPPVIAGGSGGSQLTLTTDPALTSGSYPLDIAATDGAITHHTAVTLVVPPPPDFTLVATPSSSTVSAGGSTQYAVTVGSLHGFTGDASLSVAGLPPSGVSGAFSPGVVAGGSGSSTLTVTTTGGAPAGTFPLTITATSGSTTRAALVTLVIGPPAPAPDFVLAVTPGMRTVTRGQSTSYTVSVSGSGGFASPVALTVVGLPAGASATFSKNSVTPPGSSLLTIRTSRSTTRGTFTLRIAGKSGAIAHQVNATLVVKAGAAWWQYWHWH